MLYKLFINMAMESSILNFECGEKHKGFFFFVYGNVWKVEYVLILLFFFTLKNTKNMEKIFSTVKK